MPEDEDEEEKHKHPEFRLVRFLKFFGRSSRSLSAAILW